MHARGPRIKCNTHGRKAVDLPWARKGSGFSLHFAALIVEMGKEMPVSAVVGIVETIRTGINSDVVEGQNNKIMTAFKRSYGFRA